MKLGKKMGESSVLEKKIAIYEKALAYHPNSEELLLGYLECCQKVMEADKLSALWDRIIAQHPGRMRLWKAFIRFHQVCAISLFFFFRHISSCQPSKFPHHRTG